MKLLTLNLRNFRQHVATEICFEAGLTSIVGENGSGKSTVVEAIAFALYGSKALRGKLEDVKTRGAKRNEECSVELRFEHEEKVYRIFRSLDDAELYVGGEPEAFSKGGRDTVARISSILGMDAQEFSAAFYTEQKSLEFLAGKKGATERERFIVRMLGYDKLEKMQELLRSERRDKKSELVGREAALGDKALLEEKLKQEEEALRLNRAREKELSQGLVTQEKEEKRIYSKLQQLEVVRAEYLNRNQELLRRQARYAEKTERVLALDLERKQLREKLQACSVEVDDLELRRKQQAELQQKIEADSARIREALSVHEQTTQSCIAERQGKIAFFDQRIAELDRRVKDLKQLDQRGDCPTCGQDLRSGFLQVRERVVNDLEAAHTERKEITKEITQLKKVPKEILDLRTEIGKLDAQKAVAAVQAQALDQLERELIMLSRLDQELSQAHVGIAAVNEELAALRKELTGLRFSESEYDNLKKQHASVVGVSNLARVQRVKAEGEVLRAEDAVKRTQAEIQNWNSGNSEIEILRKRLVLLEQSDKALLEFRTHLNSSIRPRLSDWTSQFISELSDGKFTTVEIEEDFTPKVIDEMGPRAVLSGGEQDILDLSLRLGLSHLLLERAGHGVSLLILDEVFGSLDEHRRGNVLALLERLTNRFEQVIFITHFDDLKEAAHNLLHVDYEAESGVSKIKNSLQSPQDYEPSQAVGQN